MIIIIEIITKEIEWTKFYPPVDPDFNDDPADPAP